MGKKTDPNIVVETRCAVTMFDMKLKVLKDGRERGLWFDVGDESPERTEQVMALINHTTDFVLSVPGLSKRQKFAIGLRLGSSLLSLLKTNEMMLVEWPQLKKVSAALRDEIIKHLTPKNPRADHPPEQRRAQVARRKKATRRR